MVEFVKWDSTARLFRDIIITEKLDGTNACVIIERIDEADLLVGEMLEPLPPNRALRVFNDAGLSYAVYAQSRNRLITPSSDNAGFAKWVERNYQQLFYVLGEGRHYGEWWGQGIGRKYDMDRKVFSVFNTAGWYSENMGTPETREVRAHKSGIDINCVPVLAELTFNESAIREVAYGLKVNGSVATEEYTSEAYPNPEGICIYHKAADTIFKYTFDSNDKHKWEFDPEVSAPKTMGVLAGLRDRWSRRK